MDSIRWFFESVLTHETELPLTIFTSFGENPVFKIETLELNESSAGVGVGELPVGEGRTVACGFGETEVLGEGDVVLTT